MNKRNIIIALVILAALLIYPFRAQLRQLVFGQETGLAPAPVPWQADYAYAHSMQAGIPL